MKTDTGVVSAYAEFGDYLDNAIAKKNQYLVPLYASMQWNVERHRADLHIDYSIRGSGVRIIGTKCDGPVGQWNLRMYGTVGPVEYTGTFNVDLAENLGGMWTADSKGIGPIAYNSTLQATGAATYDKDASTLTVSGSSTNAGTVTLPILGTVGFGGSAGADAAIPVQVGVQPECTNS